MTVKTDAGAVAISIEREFNAPCEQVWQAWTDPAVLMRWWGPAEFSSPAARIDLRVGGNYLFCMQGPDGKEYWSTGTYREIVPRERIVCTDAFADSDGKVVPASHYGMGEDWPEELLITLTFNDKDGKTHFTLSHTGVPGESMREMCRQSWCESLDKLAVAVANES